jgi:hypothetical protein
VNLLFFSFDEDSPQPCTPFVPALPYALENRANEGYTLTM